MKKLMLACLLLCGCGDAGSNSKPERTDRQKDTRLLLNDGMVMRSFRDEKEGYVVYFGFWDGKYGCVMAAVPIRQDWPPKQESEKSK